MITIMLWHHYIRRHWDLEVNQNFSGSHVTLQHISAVKISVTGLYRLDRSWTVNNKREIHGTAPMIRLGPTDWLTDYIRCSPLVNSLLRHWTEIQHLHKPQAFDSRCVHDEVRSQRQRSEQHISSSDQRAEVCSRHLDSREMRTVLIEACRLAESTEETAYPTWFDALQRVLIDKRCAHGRVGVA